MRHSGFSVFSSKAFTLLEMLIAIVIFTLISIFLYRSLSTVNSTNRFYGQQLNRISYEQKLLKTLYLDLSMAVIRSVFIINQDKDTDVVLMQTSHSVHQRILPYVGYVVRNKKLYRIESSDKLAYPFNEETEMVVDEVGEIEHFRLYASKTHFLLDYSSNEDPKLMKIRGLNY